MVACDQEIANDNLMRIKKKSVQQIQMKMHYNITFKVRYNLIKYFF